MTVDEAQPTMEKSTNSAGNLKEREDLKEGTSTEVIQSMNWSLHMFYRYTKSHVPAMPVVDVDKVEELAREKMKDYPGAFMYCHGSAGTGATEKANRAAFDRFRIIPRMMRGGLSRSTEISLFGKRYGSPLLLAPIGVQGILHPEAELATARAARNVGVPMIMSTASSRSIEDVAEANGDSDRWFQLYWIRTTDVAISILDRAARCGFTTLVVTLDTITIGWRPHDIERKYFPFGHGTGCAVGASDAAFMRLHGYSEIKHNKHVEYPYDPDELDRRAEAGDEEVRERMKFGNIWSREMNSGLFRSWDDIRFLREHWSGPIVAKGIQCVEDAEMAIDYVDGIVVSNHGGRQIDGAMASLDALDKICASEKIKEAQKSGKFAVIFDSGIRTGSDIIKALALGAQAVLYGRPYMYGLTIAGEAGVEEQVRNILADFEVTMGLCGFNGVGDLVGNRASLQIKS